MTSVPKMPTEIPMPPVKPPKKESKIKRIYEDDNWVVDLIGDRMRISYFEDCHFVDEIILTKEHFEKQ